MEVIPPRPKARARLTRPPTPGTKDSPFSPVEILHEVTCQTVALIFVAARIHNLKLARVVVASAVFDGVVRFCGHWAFASRAIARRICRIVFPAATSRQHSMEQNFSGSGDPGAHRYRSEQPTQTAMPLDGVSPERRRRVASARWASQVRGSRLPSAFGRIAPLEINFKT